MEVMMTFGWVSVMLLVGILCRALIKPLANILVPACVTGGIIGFILMNTGVLTRLGATSNACNTIVGVFFTLSFISIGLTAVPKDENSGTNAGKEAVKGTIGMGCVWNMLYAVQPLVGLGVLLLIGAGFGLAPQYGLLIPFAFCQGPGQSATFGGMIQEAGWEGAQQVAITYAVLGFLFAFLVGVPIAKYGMKHGLPSYPRKISPAIARGIYKPEEQTQVAGMMTTYNGNIDTLGFNAALIGLCYVITVPICNLLKAVPISFINTIGSMTFFIGLFVAYGVRWLMGVTGVKKYHDDNLQARITGFTTDYLITAAFMAVMMTVVGKWLVPILVVAVVTGLVTFAFCLFFASRIGGKFDFERVLGLWGCATGTCPSGVALIRIVDPELKTTAASEMGSMNIIMIPATILAPLIIEYCKGSMQFTTLCFWFAVIFAGSLAFTIITRNFHLKPSFTLRGAKHHDELGAEE